MGKINGQWNDRGHDSLLNNEDPIQIVFNIRFLMCTLATGNCRRDSLFKSHMCTQGTESFFK